MVRVPRRLVPLPAALALVFGVGCPDQALAAEEIAPLKHPLLWIVEAKPRIYLYGTIHLFDRRFTSYGEVTERAFAQADVVCTEVRLDSQSLRRAADLIQLAEGESLYECLPGDLGERLGRALEARGLEPARFRRLKPWAFLMQLSQMANDPAKVPKTHVGLSPDLDLWYRALAAHKKTDALESLAEQIDLLASIPEAEVFASLTKMVAFMEENPPSKEPAAGTAAHQPGSLVDLADAYLAGNESRIATIVRSWGKDATWSEVFFERMFSRRNVSMTARLLEKRKESPEATFFVAVGVGHLVGRGSIPDLLAKQGFSVRRVESLAELQPMETRKPSFSRYSPIVRAPGGAGGRFGRRCRAPRSGWCLRPFRFP